MKETPQELIARLMQHVEDTMDDASVDYPVEFRAGASISYDSDFLQKCFEAELAASLAREAAETARLAEAEAALATARAALLECQAEIDAYSLQEYSLDHPVHERYRKRDYDANPARAALALIPATPPNLSQILRTIVKSETPRNV